jgi:hypothetical protein
MNEPMAGRSEIGQPEPMQDYGLTEADRMIAASVLSDIEILEMHGNAVPGEWATNTINFARAIEAAVLARQSVPDDFVAQLQALEKEALAIIAAGSVAQSVPDDVARDAARYRFMRALGGDALSSRDERIVKKAMDLANEKYNDTTPEVFDAAVDAGVAAIAAPLPPKEQP